MQTKNAIKYLADICRAVFKNNNIIKNFNYMALVTVLVAGVISSACSTTRIEVHPNSSLDMGSESNFDIPIIKDGTNLVIYLIKEEPGSLFTTGGGGSTFLWLETSQEGLEIGENKKTIKEWSRLHFLILAHDFGYSSSNGSGVLKIRKQNEKGFFGGQKTSFHGTASFNFTDPSRNSRDIDEQNINWTFLLNKREGALFFPIKESNK